MLLGRKFESLGSQIGPCLHIKKYLPLHSLPPLFRELPAALPNALPVVKAMTSARPRGRYMTSEPPALTPEAALAPEAAAGTRLPLPDARFVLGGGIGGLMSLFMALAMPDRIDSAIVGAGG